MISAPTAARSASTCPSCGGPDVRVFYEFEAAPVHSCLLCPTEAEARAFARGEIALAVCNACGFISNTCYDAELQRYSAAYEDQQGYSPTFDAFATRLAEDLVARHQLRHVDIVEIGCSKGDFLLRLCELGYNRGVGIDPSVIPGRVVSPASERVRFVAEPYSEAHTSYAARLICCRHTLEHIADVGPFLGRVHRAALRAGATVFFEVPDTDRVLGEGAFWDIYYEHCSYFTPGSMARAFRAAGFAITRLERDYGDQYLLLEADPAEPSAMESTASALEESVQLTLESVARFERQVRLSLSTWHERFVRWAAEGRRVAIWGSGSKCVAFLSTIGETAAVGAIVDINPHRHGKFIPGIAKPIASPSILGALQPDTIVVMNPIYRDEISSMLRQAGVRSDITVLGE